jgi:hypothetical protein
VNTLSIADLNAASDKAAKLAKDAFYVTVGAGVLAAQRVQVQRREFEKKAGAAKFEMPSFAKFDMSKLSDSFDAGDLVEKLTDGAKAVDAQIIKFEARVDAAIDQAQTFLPAPAQKVVDAGQAYAVQTRAQVRKLARLA